MLPSFYLLQSLVQILVLVSSNILASLVLSPSKSSFSQYSLGVLYPLVSAAVSSSKPTISPSLTAITEGA